MRTRARSTFLYQDGVVRDFRFQFVEQTAPYLLGQHFVAWGRAQVEGVGLAGVELAGADPKRLQAGAREELRARLPSQPWSELARIAPAGALDGFGGPVTPQCRVATALVWDGTLYYQDVVTPYGPYPYPLEMRFGVRSIMKSVATPLSLLRLAHLYGPYVLTLKIGDYVRGFNPKYDHVRFIDAANMATGFRTATFRTTPNDINDGYLGGDYDAWYTAPSHEEKVAQIALHLRPYPWDPGTVVRYRDQDFYLLGAALDRFLKSVRGPGADAWDMLLEEVFAPSVSRTLLRSAPATVAIKKASPGSMRATTRLSTIWQRSRSCIRTAAPGAASRSSTQLSRVNCSHPTERCSKRVTRPSPGDPATQTSATCHSTKWAFISSHTSAAPTVAAITYPPCGGLARAK